MNRTTTPLVLIVDDDAAHRMMLVTLMEEWGYGVEEARDGLEAVERIRRGPVDLILMDLRMPRLDGIEATRAIHEYNAAIPIIILTAYSSIPSAVEALKTGAFDYLTKPIDFEALKVGMERALEHTHLRSENEELKRQLARFQIPEMVGHGTAMKRLSEMIALVAPTEVTVLITGESGTGKGLVARAIHAHSVRREKPLVDVNCAAIPESLIESELFGHEKGAFTGADRLRRGRFSMADGGTLFLDEIGELPLSMQAKLLRAIQEGVIQRVGSDAALRVDVRILAATNRNLEKMVAEGTFREDLFYRLNVMSLVVPPLRDRPEDIPNLVSHFLPHLAEKNHKRVKGLTPQALDLFLRYPWPGNVRELENALERAVILMPGEFVSERELPLPLQTFVAEARACSGETTKTSQETLTEIPGKTLEDMERLKIFQTLEEVRGNKSEAARRLGITRRTLKLKLKKYEAVEVEKENAREAAPFGTTTGNQPTRGMV
ncbi:sigma-54 dependent transcriptional regulator [Desulforhabdus sp. TSK]|uniref:sigma-54-dependent transcriptional regulator n=1 Tax=Desulforhabdus sp. TSK TaxID=2925014 RepID=UPI001FC84C2E|nr:sigma-54 dependent transcriptional regulator [Desulforhabdus sp. TSK]GKT09759.1 acetoacetate metabolism regulatory protein AtoC [Desulforhabdus sp. TSK]